MSETESPNLSAVTSDDKFFADTQSEFDLSLASLTYAPDNQSHLSYCVDNWIRSFRNSFYSGPMGVQRYWECYRAEIRELLARTRCFILCNADDDNQYFGFICYELRDDMPPIIHFLYVKDGFRERGFAKTLCEMAGINPYTRFYFTYKTTAYQHKLARWAGRFDPFLARYATTPEKYRRGVVNEG